MNINNDIEKVITNNIVSDPLVIENSEKTNRKNTKNTKLTQNKCVQKCFCLVKIACYHAKSTGEKKMLAFIRKQFNIFYQYFFF